MTDYRSLPGLNWSVLKHMADSPLAYRHAVDAPAPPETAAQRVGSIMHTAVLEPHLLDERVAVWDGTSTRTAEYRDWAAERGDRYILAPESRKTDGAVVDLLRGVSEAIARHPVARALLSHGEAEVPMQWMHGRYDEDANVATAVQCKGLADWLVREPTPQQADDLGLDDDHPILCDLKFLRDLDRLPSQVARYRYHGQLAHYADGVKAITGHVPAVYLLAVSKRQPYDVAVLRLDTTDALRAGRRLRDDLLARVIECERTDTWPGAYPGVTHCDLPGWADGVLDDDDFIVDEEG